MKKITTFILVALLPLVANAYDAQIDGIYYNFSGDEAEVTYKYWYANYFSDCSGDVVIPEFVNYNDRNYRVTKIGNGAFYGCSGLTSVTIGNGVTTIGSSAFSGCRGLTSITIPESVTSISSNYAFYGCSGLTSIQVESGNTIYDSRNNCNAIIKTATNTLIAGCQNTIIPNSVTSIGVWAFAGCNISSVTIPNSVTSIGEGAFSQCSSLTSVNISEGVTSIGEEAFSFCSDLTTITIPNTVTSIGTGAFNSCSSLTSITIPHSVTNIGRAAFVYCSSLTSIQVESGNTVYDSRNDCNAIIETETNTLIRGCQNTIIPNTVTGIGIEAFNVCTSLTSITIPGSVTSIGYGAFNKCSGLTSITIPNSVTSIGDYAFGSCSGLSAIIIPNSVTSIGLFAFCGCIGLTSITIPSSVTSIGRDAFRDCSGLTSITIPESLTSIGNDTFNSCSGLTSVTIPNSVTSIGESAFGWCSGLTSVIVDRATPPTIASSTFYASNQSNAALFVPYGCKAAYDAADYWKDFNEIVEFNPINVGGTGFATYCSECDLDFSEVSGLKAYIASGFSPSTGKLVLTRVTEVPAGEGLYIVGDEGRYNIPATTTDMFYSNLLKGITTATTIYPTDGDYTNFILANGSHGVAFYSLSAAGELAAGKAYLQLPTASVSEVKAISVIFDDDEDAIQSIVEESQTERIYNLQGQQVNAPKNGLYIVNGKKVFIK